MKKRIWLLLLLIWMVLVCTGCRQQPPAGLVEETPQDARVIDAEPDDAASLQLDATLYFRYGDTALLRQESRQITMLPNETREKALVSALLEGSRDAASAALFPEKTQVLATQAQDGVIYITFNEALYGSYADESKLPEEALLRRKLALAALTATLTESGEYRSVQVLVRAEENVGRSMRLTTRFFGDAAETVVPPLLRQQEGLPTPAAYARELLNAWQIRDWDALSSFVTARSGSLQKLMTGEELGAAPVLTTFALYDGTVSPDGASAVVCADLYLRGAEDTETQWAAYPLRLINENGAWKIPAAQLKAMMGENDD